jgi:CDP-glycerol glycerophosphotransferase (TagB/SpsB family)
MMSGLTEKFGALDRIFAKAENFSYNDVFCRGSLLLTDYSSTQFDFAYLKKPVVYTQFDKDEFYASHTYKQGYFDYERSGFGEVEYTKDSTVDRLIEYMENGCTLKDEYRLRSDEFFAFNDKNNCERIANEILKINGKRL